MDLKEKFTVKPSVKLAESEFFVSVDTNDVLEHYVKESKENMEKLMRFMRCQQ